MAGSNVSSVVNFFATANEGFTTTASGNVLSGAATVGLTSVTGLTDGSIFVGIIEPGLTNQQVFTGTVSVSTSSVTGVIWTRGTNVAHGSGTTIVDYVTGTDFNMLVKGILVGHNQDGTHKPSSFARETTITSSATPTPNADTTSLYTITALATAPTFGAPTSTSAPTQGQTLLIRIKDNGTARVLAWNAIYRAVGVTIPTTTVISKTLYVGMVYNSTDTKWDVVFTVIEA